MKGLVVTILLILTVFAGISQTNTKRPDTTCIPNSQLIESIKDREAHKILKKEFTEVGIKMSTLVELLRISDSTARALKKMDTINNKKIATYQESEKSYIEGEKRSKEQVGTLTKLAKRKGVNGFFKGALAGIVVTVVTGLLISK